MNSHLKTIVIWLVVIAAVVIGYKIFDTASSQRQQMDQSDVLRGRRRRRDRQEVTITGDAVGYEIRGKLRSATRPDPPVSRSRTSRPTSSRTKSCSRRCARRACMVKAEKPRDGSFLALLLTWSPMLLFLGVWIFFMRQMQSGGNRALSFGKSRAKLTSAQGRKVTFKRRGRRRGGQGRAAGDHRVPQGAAEVPEARRQDPQGRAADGPARARARRCWPGRSPARPTCRSSRSPAPTSSRCSSASAPRACATCSSRARRTPRASSSSTRSTPSAATAAPASAAATTSASRR